MDTLIYLLEDDEDICQLISTALELNNLPFEYFTTVKAFEQALLTKQPSIAILDIMLSDGNGLDVLSKIRQGHSNIYCIMLSALSKEFDKVKALNIGADDYITKPFGVLELIAKLKAVIRRLEGSKTTVITIGDLILNNENLSVTLQGNTLELTNREFKLMKLFMTNTNKVLSREVILSKLWGYDAGEVRTLDNYVTHLRKLGVTNIETIFGVGYQFVVK